MQTLGNIIWLILRVLILICLFLLVVGTGICGWLLYDFSSQYHSPDPLEVGFLFGLAALAALFTWVFWVTLRAFFLSRPADSPALSQEAPSTKKDQP